jgi:hypothetical protein
MFTTSGASSLAERNGGLAELNGLEEKLSAVSVSADADVEPPRVSKSVVENDGRKIRPRSKSESRKSENVRNKSNLVAFTHNPF